MLERGDDPADVNVQDLLRFAAELSAGEIRVVPPDASIVAMSGEAADTVVDYLIFRRWILYDTPNILITSDEPVVLVGGPEFPRDEAPGIGNAAAVLFPIAPRALIGLWRDDIAPHEPGRARLDAVETAVINREIAMSAARWVFERPSKNVGKHLRVPAAPQMSLEEHKLVDGDNVRRLVRSFRRTRWAALPTAPWPVERWWNDLTVLSGNRRPPIIDIDERTRGLTPRRKGRRRLA